MAAPRLDADQAPEVSIVIPCLNEEEAIAAVVGDARLALAEAGIDGEVLVVDNASEDRSAELRRANRKPGH